MPGTTRGRVQNIATKGKKRRRTYPMVAAAGDRWRRGGDEAQATGFEFECGGGSGSGKERKHYIGLAVRVCVIDVVIRVAGASVISYGGRLSTCATCRLISQIDEPTCQRRAA
jgi:hypothetical protein